MIASRPQMESDLNSERVHIHPAEWTMEFPVPLGATEEHTEEGPRIAHHF